MNKTFEKFWKNFLMIAGAIGLLNVASECTKTVLNKTDRDDSNKNSVIAFTKALHSIEDSELRKKITEFSFRLSESDKTNITDHQRKFFSFIATLTEDNPDLKTVAIFLNSLAKLPSHDERVNYCRACHIFDTPTGGALRTLKKTLSDLQTPSPDIVELAKCAKEFKNLSNNRKS